MAWAKLGTDTNLSPDTGLSVTPTTPVKFNHFLFHTDTTATATNALTVNSSGTAGTSYADRRSVNGASDVVATSQPYITSTPNTGANYEHFTRGYWINISGEEKLFIYHTVTAETTGAGTAPQRREAVSKYANTALGDGSTQVDVVSGNLDTGSNLTVLTGDETETTRAVQDGTIFEETDTNKAYIWSSSSQTWTQL